MIGTNRHSYRIGAFLLVLSVLLASCQTQQTPTVTPTSAASATPAASPTPIPSPTAPPRSLVICLGQEPETLYLYGRLTASSWSVLEAVYDGPIDRSGYTLKPVILQQIPSIEGKDVVVQPVSVNPGDEMVDANGDLVTLAEGTRYYPSGCNSADCAATSDGKTPVQMDQMVVTYKLLPNLTWSDGQPLTAADSVYSYSLAADADTPVSKFTVNRTVSYQALDDTTVEWTGKPGYMAADLAAVFWSPLPEHLWSALKAADLLQNEAAVQKPVGWGAYQIDEWVKGDHIRLQKNPNYFRAAEGLPKFDTLVFRFIGENGNANVNTVLAGECDLVDRTGNLNDQLALLDELQQAKKLTAVYGAGPDWEHLDFGIRPVSYDDGYNSLAGDRPDLFSDVRTRQAFAACIDRQGIVDTYLGGHSTVPASYLPEKAPAYDTNVKQYAYDQAQGKQLLDEAGWKDTDQDPGTPRVAQGIPGVMDGTPLTVTLLTTQATLRQKAAEMVASSLSGCGVQVETRFLSPGDLFAAGPDGPLFGRKFDLALFSWDTGTRTPCFLYTTARIPDAKNHWVGENITGYSNPEFDAACQAALQLSPGQTGYAESQAKAQELFAENLPVIPLYNDIQVAASRTDFCGFDLDPSARSDLANVESFDVDASCTAK